MFDAGLAAALLLSGAGCRVTLFERFEAPRPLGSGLLIQPTGLAVLERLGLAARLRNQASEVDRVFGQVAGSGRTVLDVRYRAIGSSRGLGVHRATLFQLLFEAVTAAGVSICTGRTVTGAEIVSGEICGFSRSSSKKLPGAISVNKKHRAETPTSSRIARASLRPM